MANILRGESELRFGDRPYVVRVTWGVANKIAQKYGKAVQDMLALCSSKPFEHVEELATIFSLALEPKNAGPQLTVEEILDEACGADLENIAKALFESLRCKPWEEIEREIMRHAKDAEPDTVPLADAPVGE